MIKFKRTYGYIISEGGFSSLPFPGGSMLRLQESGKKSLNNNRLRDFLALWVFQRLAFLERGIMVIFWKEIKIGSCRGGKSAV